MLSSLFFSACVQAKLNYECIVRWQLITSGRYSTEELRTGSHVHRSAASDCQPSADCHCSLPRDNATKEEILSL